MKTTIAQKTGLVIVIVVSIAYTIIRISTIISQANALNIIAAICELSLVGLVCVESVLMASSVPRRARKQDESVLIESAKNILFTSEAQMVSEGDNLTKIQTTQVTAQSYENQYIDVIVFTEEATYDELRRCFLSIDLLEGVDNVYIIDASLTPEHEQLAQEFGFHVTDAFRHIATATQRVLVCRGTDVMYPDSFAVARTYDVNEKTFLELRSVYSDERALGVNGPINVSDKRQKIREALSTRALSTWSTGPAMVSSYAVSQASKATSARSFFHWCEKNNIHGMITEEIVSEEFSPEQTISEIKWRATDLIYSTGSWKNKYDTKGTRIMGLFVKAWSLLLSISFVRRLATIALVFGLVLAPHRYTFITVEYIAVGAISFALLYLGGYLSGDERGPLARIREFYFDIEAVMFIGYKSFLSNESLASDKSIVKKLPSVSALLVITDAILIYRVFFQQKPVTGPLLSHYFSIGSLFSGYALLVTMLVGLGMVIVRQSRTAMRREVSRGANIDSEPVSMIDLSPGGAGCISVSPYEIGAHVQFESSLPGKQEKTSFKCTGQIKSCIEWDGSYRVGIEFLEITQKQKDILDIYCSITFPHEQARNASDAVLSEQNATRINGKAEKRFLSYAATFVALGAIIYSNLQGWR